VSSYEYRAWLMLWGLGPAYIAYFGLQIAAPAWLVTTPQRLICFAAAAGFQAVVCLIGMTLKGGDRDEAPMSDERDEAIDSRATRAAYYLLMIGAVAVGMGMPFSQGGWKIVNGTLLSVVLAEALRNALIVRGYRGGRRLAH
jgi:hypothetical protein